MEQHETPEAIKARAEQEDPLVMYLIVRESLQMSTGKIGAQIGHAVQLLLEEYFAIFDCPEFRESYTNDEIKKKESYNLWRKTSYRKVTLTADDKEWIKIKQEISNNFYVVAIDNGLTEIPAGSETVIGVFPMKKSERSKTLKRLQVLK